MSQHVGHVDRDVPGWRDDPGRLAEYYLQAYPGTKGRLTYWLGGETPLASARRMSRAGLVISGDVAADLVAPWRVPTHLVAYASDALSAVAMGELGFTEWEPEHATLALVETPADTWLFRQATLRTNDLAPEGVRLAHPLHVAYDLYRLGGSDRIEAAAALRHPDVSVALSRKIGEDQPTGVTDEADPATIEEGPSNGAGRSLVRES